MTKIKTVLSMQTDKCGLDGFLEENSACANIRIDGIYFPVN
jgi:hypothetical protein